MPGQWYDLRFRRSIDASEAVEPAVPFVPEPAIAAVHPVDSSFDESIAPGPLDEAEHEPPAVVDEEASAQPEPEPLTEESLPPVVLAAVPVDDAPWWDLRGGSQLAATPIEIDSEFCERVRRYVA